MPVGLNAAQTQKPKAHRHGLAIPLAATKTGGLATNVGEDHDRQIIMTALLDCSCNNAFLQDGGLGDKAIFALANDQLKAELFARIRTVFDDFKRQKRFQLVPDSLQVLMDQDTGEVQMSLKYLNLETNAPSDFAMILGSSA